MGSDEEAQAESVCRSEKDTHDIEGTKIVHATLPKHSVYPKCIPGESLSFGLGYRH